MPQTSKNNLWSSNGKGRITSYMVVELSSRLADALSRAWATDEPQNPSLKESPEESQDMAS
jgi:hypothetical protein